VGSLLGAFRVLAHVLLHVYVGLCWGDCQSFAAGHAMIDSADIPIESECLPAYLGAQWALPSDLLIPLQASVHMLSVQALC
jgi:hypothetical protein